MATKPNISDAAFADFLKSKYKQFGIQTDSSNKPTANSPQNITYKPSEIIMKPTPRVAAEFKSTQSVQETNCIPLQTKHSRVGDKIRETDDKQPGRAQIALKKSQSMREPVNGTNKPPVTNFLGKKGDGQVSSRQNVNSREVQGQVDSKINTNQRQSFADNSWIKNRNPDLDIQAENSRILNQSSGVNFEKPKQIVQTRTVSSKQFLKQENQAGDKFKEEKINSNVVPKIYVKTQINTLSIVTAKQKENASDQIGFRQISEIRKSFNESSDVVLRPLVDERSKYVLHIDGNTSSTSHEDQIGHQGFVQEESKVDTVFDAQTLATASTEMSTRNPADPPKTPRLRRKINLDQFLKQKVKMTETPEVVRPSVAVTSAVFGNTGEAAPILASAGFLRQLGINARTKLALQCPVCYQLMQPPIYRCVANHPVCPRCLPLLPDCSTCQGEMTTSRRADLEAMCLAILIQCKLCDQEVPAVLYEAHEEYCAKSGVDL